MSETQSGSASDADLLRAARRDPDAFCEFYDRHARRLTAVSELPAAQQRAVGLRVVDELPYAEVAKRLECSPAAARLRVSRALRALNKRLEGGAP